MSFAHVAGVPVEELAPLALVGGAGLLAWARAWLRERVRFVQDRRRPPA
jgi:hypothetical protein